MSGYIERAEDLEDDALMALEAAIAGIANGGPHLALAASLAREAAGKLERADVERQFAAQASKARGSA